MPANNYIAVIQRTMLVLEAFRGQRNLRLADLAARTRMVKSSVFRILFTLERLGYVEKGADGRYSISSRLARLSGPFGLNPIWPPRQGPSWRDYCIASRKQ